MTRNMLLVLPLLLWGGAAVAQCDDQSAAKRAGLEEELARAAENLARGYRIRSYEEAGFRTTPQRVPLRVPSTDGQLRLSGQWMTRHVYLDPDDPSKPLDQTRLHAPIDPVAEAQRRDGIRARLDAMGPPCAGQ